MKFQTSKLREAVALAARQTQDHYRRRDAANAEAYERELAEWTEKYAGQWAQACTRIRARLRKGEPIRSRDLPTMGRYDGVAIFGHTPPKPRGAYEMPTHLRVIANAIEMIEDEYVTDTQLARLGVRAGQLRHLFELMPKDT